MKMNELIKTVSVETMRKSDAWTIANKVSSAELMKRAGKGIYEAAVWTAPVAVVCGKGNNAGDGFVVASLLKDAGIECDIFLISDSFSDDGRYYYDICMEKGIRALKFSEQTDLSSYRTVLDCIFGTGFQGEPKGIYASAIDAINSSGAYVVCADINSGLNGDTGSGTKYVVSDLTVSIGDYKPGHFKGLAYGAMKERTNTDIGIVIQGSYIMIREPDLIVLADLNTGKEIHFRDAGSFEKMDNAFEGLDYFERTEKYALEYVLEEDRQLFRDVLSLENIKKSIKEGKVNSHVYRVCLDGKTETVETSYIPYRAGMKGSHLAIKTVTRITRD